MCLMELLFLEMKHWRKCKKKIVYINSCKICRRFFLCITDRDCRSKRIGFPFARILANSLLYVRPSARLSIMWVCVQLQSVAYALAQGRLFCKGGFCVLALCALQMCLTWCVGSCRQSIESLNVCRMSFRVTYNGQGLPKYGN